MNYSFVCGFDEAGRGPLAGPVTAGCVILPPDFPVEILNDSKKLSEKKRIAAESIIKEKACWGIGIVDHTTIDEINILQSSMKAMSLAYDMMLSKLETWCKNNNMDHVIDVSELTGIVDGTKCPVVSCTVTCEPKADGKYPAVMAASILAKVCRDKIMDDYDKLYPEYGYAKHKGYPTKAHREICHKIGPSPIQRKTFRY